MKRLIPLIMTLTLLLAAGLMAQETQKDRVEVELSDTSKPVTLECGLVNGSITVQGYDGKTVVVEASTKTPKDQDGDGKKNGMFRIPVSSSSMSVEEHDNHVEISTSSYRRAMDLTIQVPRLANLQVSTINDGDIIISNIEGEVEVENVNGDVTATNIAGSLVGHAHNGNLKVTFSSIKPETPMSFASFNGNVDITLPASLNADVTFKNEQGEVYSDFPVEKVDKPRQVVDKNRDDDGRYRVQIENAYFGRIGKGGPEFKFTNYNGDIFIRRGK